jgi:hypothetical protein
MIASCQVDTKGEWIRNGFNEPETLGQGFGSLYRQGIKPQYMKALRAGSLSPEGASTY